MSIATRSTRWGALFLVLVAASCKPKPITLGSAGDSRAVDVLAVTTDGVIVGVGRRFGGEKDTEGVLEAFDAKGKPRFQRALGKECTSPQIVAPGAGVVFAGSCVAPVDLGSGPVPGIPADEFAHLVVAAIDPNAGTVKWVGAHGKAGGSQFANGLGVDTTGDVFVGGTYWGGLDFGEPGMRLAEPPPEVRRATAYLAKLDGTTGREKWARVVGASRPARVESLAVLPNGDVVVVGELQSELVLDAKLPPLTAAGQAGFVARFDGKTASARWAVLAPLPGAGRLLADARVAVMANGNVAVAGSGNDTVVVAELEPEGGKVLWEKRVAAKSVVGLELLGAPAPRLFLAFHAADADFGKGRVRARPDAPEGTTGGHLLVLGEHGDVVHSKTYGDTFDASINALAWNPKTKAVIVSRQGKNGPKDKSRDAWLVTETWLETTIEPAFTDEKKGR